MQVCLGAAIGISRPESVAWCSSGLFTGLLGFLMLSMGLTLTFEDFKKVGSINTLASVSHSITKCAMQPIMADVSP